MQRKVFVGAVLAAVVLVAPAATQQAASATKAGKFTITLRNAIGGCGPVKCDLSGTWIKDNMGNLRCLHGVFTTSCVPQTAKYPAGTVVTLSAGSNIPPLEFAGWGGGDCASAGAGKCKLTMDSDKTIEAVFKTP